MELTQKIGLTTFMFDPQLQIALPVPRRGVINVGLWIHVKKPLLEEEVGPAQLIVMAMQ